MYRKRMITACAALVLTTFLGTTDALASRKHTAKAGGQKNAANIVSRRIAAQARRAKGTKLIPAANNTNFGANGPYVGVKYIGN